MLKLKKMIELDNRISAFAKLGEVMREGKDTALQHLVDDSVHYNGWFTQEMVEHMLRDFNEMGAQWPVEHKSGKEEPIELI